MYQSLLTTDFKNKYLRDKFKITFESEDEDIFMKDIEYSEDDSFWQNPKSSSIVYDHAIQTWFDYMYDFLDKENAQQIIKKDFCNFVLCVQNNPKEVCENHLEFFLKALLTFREFSLISIQLQHISPSCFDLFGFDPVSLLFNIADSALFVYQDWNCAFDIYRVLRYQISYSDEEFREFFLALRKVVDSTRKAYYKNWCSYFEKPVLELIENISEHKEKTNESVNQFFQYLSHELSLIKKNSTENKRALYRLRMLYCIGIYYRDSFIFEASLSFEEQEYTDEEKRVVLNNMITSKNSKVKEIQPYLYAHKRITNLPFAVTLLKAMKCAEDIKEFLKVNNHKKPIGYYTRISTLMKMAPSGCSNTDNFGKLPLLHYAYMNDPNEGQLLSKFLFREDYSCNSNERSIVSYPYVFMKCFTNQIDDLPMWEMYGDGANGCCLVFDSNSFKRFTGKRNSPQLYYICYIEDDKNFKVKNDSNKSLGNKTKAIEANLQELLRLARSIKKKPNGKQLFLNVLHEVPYLFKLAHYQHEQETRFIISLDSYKEDLIINVSSDNSYDKLLVLSPVAIPISEIIIGPKYTQISENVPYIQEQIELMCNSIHLPLPKITVSSIDYK